MLNPIAPDPRDPRYQEKLAQYRRDLAAMRERPADWGAVHPRSRPGPPAGRPASPAGPAHAAGPVGRHARKRR